MSRSTNNMPFLMDVNPDSPIAESYRALRTNIEFSSVGKTMKVIMVTSSYKGEGKSTTAANLAIALAHTGKRVVLVDADLRHASIRRRFALPNQVGLANYLALQATIEDIIHETHIANLYAIVAGSTPPNPAELLTMKQMDVLLAQLKERYDQIVIDTPPAFSVSDAQIIAAKSDGVLLVLEPGRVKRETARKVKAYLNHVNARLLGVVFNKVNRQQSDAYLNPY